MAKMAVLVPYSGLCEMAELLIRQYPRISPVCVEYVPSDQVEARARELEAQGCDMIMARGFQAGLIKKAVKMPLVEIRVTAQELGMLVLDIKEELGEERPKIGLIGFENMLCDTSCFERMLGVEVRRYLMEAEQEAEQAMHAIIQNAVQEGCQAVMGGELVCEVAKALGVVHRFISSGRESLMAAFDLANHISYALDMRKRNDAEIETMLNFTQNGIVRTNEKGTVLRANNISFDLLNCLPEDIIGKNLLQAFPTLSKELLDKTLLRGEETYAVLVPMNRKEVMISIAPIRIEQQITGAILTLQEGGRIIEMSSELRQEIYRHGYLARYRFDMIPCENASTRRTIEQASRVAKFNAPVLLFGEMGSGRDILAQCIHNASFAKGNAFIALDCSAYHPDTLDTMLFGNYTSRKDTAACMAEIAQGGTIYLSHVETLSLELQYKLQMLIRGIFMHNGSNLPVSCSVRIIASTQEDLMRRVEEGSFRSDLYYSLNAVGIKIRPLCERREDILAWTDILLSGWQERYDRTVRLTQSAKAFIQQYDWPGNLDQLNSLCEQIVLLSEHRNVDESFLRRRLALMTPRVTPPLTQAARQDEKALQLVELLKKHYGNRQKVADELGISKTTLWRRMQKYGIARDFEQ